MTVSQEPAETEVARPIGMLYLLDDDALSAFRSVEKRRVDDVAGQIENLSTRTCIDRAWKLLLQGRFLAGDMRLQAAESLLLQSFAESWIAANDDGIETSRDAMRLAATALMCTGKAQRRLDRPADAVRTHQLADNLFQQAGSFDELWCVSIELGLDAEVAKDFETAANRHQMAIEYAKKASEAPIEKQAVASHHLSVAHCESGAFGKAIDAAQSACDLWRKLDEGSLDLVRADYRLGEVRLRQDQSLLEEGNASAGQSLKETIGILERTESELAAFGSRATADVKLCSDQLDFARRILQSMES